MKNYFFLQIPWHRNRSTSVQEVELMGMPLDFLPKVSLRAHRVETMWKKLPDFEESEYFKLLWVEDCQGPWDFQQVKTSIQMSTRQRKDYLMGINPA